MSETRTQRLLAAVLDDTEVDDDLVRDLAASSDAHGELVRLAAVLARLPGKGARAAEARLDVLLDDVALAAASATHATHATLEAPPDRVAPTASRPRQRIRRIAVPAAAGVAAAIAVVLVVAWSRHGAGVTTSRGVAEPASPMPTVVPLAREPALVDVEIRVQPSAASISIDDEPVANNPFSRRYTVDSGAHRIQVTAAGYIAKSITMAFNANVILDVSLEREPPAAIAAAPAGPSGSRTGPADERAMRRAGPSGSWTGPADERAMRRESKRIATLERWVAEADASAPHRAEVEQTVAALQQRFGTILITTDVPGCEIAIDDVVVATTPLSRPLRVSVGAHSVRVRHEGYAEQTCSVDVTAARTVLALSVARIDASGGTPRPGEPAGGSHAATPVDAPGTSPAARPIDPCNPYERSP